ncbi:YeeE/YedE family protein [Acinetobacter rudis]|uniref:YeeE/YedE thiosulfate transporter family protein n=1 Tax=Acinetobacter rudis TaxID=632955 RepID=A0AAW8JCB3_9GAMM|nr:YeeE/YedE thiosulfate transporter family protein [Acinetobacter rudis]MDQ8936336.1 YeeE/YedE thiosulfate transporter family protein [Acinetobacter rudis]MDQ9018597.1 YeeE/YedE thiosulfate transporter family protein [Acinetobacter rudis]
MHEYIVAWLGGMLLGIATVGYLYVHGRIAGISGMLTQVLNKKTFVRSPAKWFLLGMILSAALYGFWQQPNIDFVVQEPWLFILAGILVGFGTSMGSGCTSGHGICGISRLSKRSFVATACFMAAAMLTVWLTRHVWGIL